VKWMHLAQDRARIASVAVSFTRRLMLHGVSPTQFSHIKFQLILSIQHLNLLFCKLNRDLTLCVCVCVCVCVCLQALVGLASFKGI